jgi:hypothetical protein
MFLQDKKIEMVKMLGRSIPPRRQYLRLLILSYNTFLLGMEGKQCYS